MKQNHNWILLFFMVFCANSDIHAQAFNLFTLSDIEEVTNQNLALVSLSDIHGPLNEQPDSLTVPYVEYGVEEKSKYQIIDLNNEYRMRFLKNVKTSETDSLFVYDYSKNILKSFVVKNLKIIAFLNIYEDLNNCPCSQSSYMLGFQLDKKELACMSMYYKYVFASIGKKNPFQIGKMKSIEWKHMDSVEISKLKFKPKKFEGIDSIVVNHAYTYQTTKYIFYVIDLKAKNEPYSSKRQIQIYDAQTRKLMVDELFVESEGSSLAPLNVPMERGNRDVIELQWFGPLLRDAPFCIFGFEWVSFGCTRIALFQPANSFKYNSVVINCDNRH
jgi:hypothetical protein